MKVTLQLDDEYADAVNKRIDQLQNKRARQIRKVGSDELADEIEASDPDAAGYIKELVRADLDDAGVIDE